jgi:UDP-N-acetylmuramoyl-L-alanyl-D-glutamate--2,6-diaminopimelate ligase
MMQWNVLLATIEPISFGGIGNPDILDVTADSRSVVFGSLYVSIHGFKQNGDAYIADAVARGAVAILSEQPQPDCGVPWAQVRSTRMQLGLASRRVWNVSTAETLFVGITGTNGKTTTAYLFQKLLSLTFGSDAVWMYGTVAYSVNNKKTDALRTTPESSDIFRAIGKAENKPSAVVMEVSSHALVLNRIAGLNYDCAVWTNLTQDHLDFHTTMEAYYQAKKILFTSYLNERGRAVINIDDVWGRRLADELAELKPVTYGQADDAVVRMDAIACTQQGTDLDIRLNGTPVHFSSRLSGHFNAYNMTALIAGAYALSIDVNTIQRCFDAIDNVPGRMERVNVGSDFSVYVDYAHTPDALENVLSTARALTAGKLVCVFGCGGDRDKTKRPLMGQAVANHCDEAIVTSDNPRSENPQTIINEILRGIPLDFPHVAIADRKEAIYKGLRELRIGDCLIVAGKGHETYQEIKGVRHPFDDHAVIAEFFAEGKK